MIGWLVFALVIWALGWWANTRLAALPRSRATSFAVPVIFGVTLVAVWEGLVK